MTKTPEILRQYVPTKEQLQKLRETGYGEVNYLSVLPNGGIVVGGGTEDFSLERWQTVSRKYCRYVYRPTGEYDKGDHRRWAQDCRIISRSVRECGILARLLYPGQEISIRQY